MHVFMGPLMRIERCFIEGRRLLYCWLAEQRVVNLIDLEEQLLMNYWRKQTVECWPGWAGLYWLYSAPDSCNE